MVDSESTLQVSAGWIHVLVSLEVAAAQLVPALFGIRNEKTPSGLMSAAHLAYTALTVELQSLALAKSRMDL